MVRKLTGLIGIAAAALVLALGQAELRDHSGAPHGSPQVVAEGKGPTTAEPVPNP